MNEARLESTPAATSMLGPRLLARYGSLPVPRYTSYPSANVWRAFDEGEARGVLRRFGARPLSLYVHVPFCAKLCLYCGCNTRITRNGALVERYLAALEVEIEHVSGVVPRANEVVQLHLGGGTPTHLDEAQLRRVVGVLRERFPFAKELEASIEVHPPVTTESQMRTLAELGFNRVSMGVQDFDPDVQRRVNRIQPYEQTRDLIVLARELGFVSVNVDLMYGLPRQTPERFATTLDKVEALRPDRIALFGYAHMPQLKKHMRVFQPNELPDTAMRLELLELGIERLTRAGYVYVGLDHFAMPDDELVVAREAGTLRRNFMGYTTCAESDVLALGPSSISEVGGAFLQNAREVGEWADLIERGGLPGVRGWLPTLGDDVRRALIAGLFCDLRVDARAICEAYGIADPDAYLAAELERIAPLEADGLVRHDGDVIEVTRPGRLLLRTVAAAFDAYLKPAGTREHAVAI